MHSDAAQLLSSLLSAQNDGSSRALPRGASVRDLLIYLALEADDRCLFGFTRDPSGFFYLGEGQGLGVAFAEPLGAAALVVSDDDAEVVLQQVGDARTGAELSRIVAAWESAGCPRGTDLRITATPSHETR